MKKVAFLTFFCLISVVSSAQIYVVEAVTLTETLQEKFASEVPRLIDSTNAENEIVAKINRAIQEELMFDSYNQANLESFRWYDLSFKSEIKSGYLWIHYAGEYLGAYPTWVSIELFFDLKSAERLTNRNLPLHSLFQLNQYFTFLDQYWLPSAGGQFNEAIECADGVEPYCSLYDIRVDSITTTEIHLKGNPDCFPRAILACSPEVSIQVPITSIKTYLSDFGKKVLFDDGYFSLSGIDKFVYNQNATPPEYQFIFGKIADRYAISMAIETTLQDGGVSAVRGFYYYDSKKIPLTLSGTKSDQSINLTEMVEGRSTGEFTFTFHDDYRENGFRSRYLDKYITATWNTPNKTKTLPIVITEIQFNR